MTRTTDDMHPDRPWQPLGDAIKRAPAPAPQPKEIAPGVFQGADGRLHTDLPLPKEKP